MITIERVDEAQKNAQSCKCLMLNHVHTRSVCNIRMKPVRKTINIIIKIYIYITQGIIRYAIFIEMYY